MTSRTPAFTQLIDLAAARVGGRALATNDDFFASRHNLLKPGRGIFIPGKFTARGKWMDGWESRRRRTPGHDWCIVRLGMRGVVRGVDVDTNHFIGNCPEAFTLDACDVGKSGNGALSRARWVPIVRRRRVAGGAHNFAAVRARGAWTHVRLNIHPDGGVARLRVYGEVAVDWERIRRLGRPVDLAEVRNGGLAVAASDEHFGVRGNLLLPGRAPNMGEGWESRRRRGPGHDWVIVRLGTPATLERVEIDTNHFKGNYPESASLEGCYLPGADVKRVQGARVRWQTIVPRVALAAHKRHHARTLAAAGPFSHVRLIIHPDGGVSRLRVHGRPV